MEADVTEEKKRQGLPWRLVLLALALVVAACLLRIFGLGSHLHELRNWILELGSDGPLAGVALFSLAVVAAVPASVLMVVTATLFHPPWAIAVISLGSLIGSSAAFLIARYFLGQSVVEWLKKSPTFRRLDDLTHRRGATVILVTRLIPILPFNVINYCWGLTRVKLADYVLFTLVGMLPEIVITVSGCHVFEKAVMFGHVSGTWLAVLALAVVLLLLAARQTARYLGYADLHQVIEVEQPWPAPAIEEQP